MQQGCCTTSVHTRRTVPVVHNAAHITPGLDDPYLRTKNLTIYLSIPYPSLYHDIIIIHSAGDCAISALCLDSWPPAWLKLFQNSSRPHGLLRCSPRVLPTATKSHAGNHPKVPGRNQPPTCFLKDLVLNRTSDTTMSDGRF